MDKSGAVKFPVSSMNFIKSLLLRSADVRRSAIVDMLRGTKLLYCARTNDKGDGSDAIESSERG